MATGGEARRFKRRLVRTQGLDQRVMHDLDDHLTRLDRLDDIGPDGALTHFLGETLHDLQRHVCFQQRAAHFAHGGIDIRLTEAATPRE